MASPGEGSSLGTPDEEAMFPLFFPRPPVLAAGFVPALGVVLALAGAGTAVLGLVGVMNRGWRRGLLGVLLGAAMAAAGLWCLLR
jgi:hypothetical protein